MGQQATYVKPQKICHKASFFQFRNLSKINTFFLVLKKSSMLLFCPDWITLTKCFQKQGPHTPLLAYFHWLPIYFRIS